MDSFLGIPSVNCFAWTTYKGFLRGLFPCYLLRGCFPGLSFATEASLGSSELFPCASLEWFFACPLSQELLRAFYLVLYSVRFPADQFCWRPIAGVFALRFCAGPLFRAFFREAFPARSFAGLSPWVIPRCIFRANFRMDGFHGLFREVVYSVLSGGWIFGSIFSGSFSVHFLQGRLQWEHLRGAFFVRSFARVSSVQFSAGTFYLHCLVGSFYTLSCGAFILHFSAREISISSFVGAISER